MAPELLKERRTRQAKIAGEKNIDTSGGTMLVFAPYILRKGSLAGYGTEVWRSPFSRNARFEKKAEIFQP